MTDTSWTWPHRFDRLAETVGDPDQRAGLFDIWYKMTSLPDWTSKGGHQVIQWQIAIGRALLDYPELDRPAIKARIDELQPLLA